MSYLTWTDEAGRERAMASLGAALQKAEPVYRTGGSSVYLNVAPNNVSVRDGHDRGDHEYFRPELALPRNPRGRIKASMDAYDNHGIVRNVIDLMADFAVKGLDVIHQNERIEKFYKEWFRRVNGHERTERFLNLFYRGGNVLVRRHMAKLSRRDEERIQRAQAAMEPDMEMPPVPDLGRREIPLRYSFLNPLSVTLLAEGLVPFIGPEAFRFAVQVPDALARTLASPGPEQSALLEMLPADMRAAIRKGERLIPLDPAKVSAYYYKRDDWQPWANPMVSSILGDLQLLEKLKLADMAALDGAISCIRVWKLGNLEAGVMPDEATILRLAEMLNNNVGGGVMDFIWGPDIELLETKTDIHRFLGDTKYAPTLKAIFQGLGVPASLTGESSPGGFTNNHVGLKTLVERLQYGRNVARAFWRHELGLVRKAMGHRFSADIAFDAPLSDEVAEKQLLIGLADRDLISVESLQEAYGLTPEIEEVRLRREMRRRRDGLSPVKASPFHNANSRDQMAQALLGQGVYAPSELGFELEDKAPGEKTPLELKEEQAPTPPPPPPGAGGPPGAPAPKGQPGQGRPANKKDDKKRKQKVVKPQRASATFVCNLATAENLLARVSTLVTPAFLKSVGRKSLRELTEAESRRFERFKFRLLCQLQLGDQPDQASIARLLAAPLAAHPAAEKLYKKTLAHYSQTHGKSPSLEVLRRFQASVWALYRGELCARPQDSRADDGLSPLPRAQEESPAAA